MKQPTLKAIIRLTELKQHAVSIEKVAEYCDREFIKRARQEMNVYHVEPKGDDMPDKNEYIVMDKPLDHEGPGPPEGFDPDPMGVENGCDSTCIVAPTYGNLRKLEKMDYMSEEDFQKWVNEEIKQGNHYDVWGEE